MFCTAKVASSSRPRSLGPWFCKDALDYHPSFMFVGWSTSIDNWHMVWHIFIYDIYIPFMSLGKTRDHIILTSYLIFNTCRCNESHFVDGTPLKGNYQHWLCQWIWSIVEWSTMSMMTIFWFNFMKKMSFQEQVSNRETMKRLREEMVNGESRIVMDTAFFQTNGYVKQAAKHWRELPTCQDLSRNGEVPSTVRQ